MTTKLSERRPTRARRQPKIALAGMAALLVLQLAWPATPRPAHSEGSAIDGTDLSRPRYLEGNGPWSAGVWENATVPAPVATRPAISTGDEYPVPPTSGASLTLAAAPPLYTGGRIAFESGRTRNVPGGNYMEIYAMEADGSDQINLTQNPATDRFPAWSPDGAKIAFVSDRGNDAGNFDLYVMNADGSGQRRLIATTENEEWPTWSPDGQKLAFQRFASTTDPPRVFLVSADGTGYEYLVPYGDLPGDAQVAHPAWSPVDRDRIAWFYGGQTVDYTNCNSGFIGPPAGTIIITAVPPTWPWYCPENGMRWIPRTENNGYTGALNDFPAWSPDGTKLAYVQVEALPSGDFDWRLVVADAGTADQSGRLTNRSVIHSYVGPTSLGGDAAMSKPAWSPDGRQIAFVLDDPVNYHQIHVINADGTGLYNLTKVAAGDVHPSWGPVAQIRPAVYGNKVAYQTGTSAATSAIVVRDQIAGTSTTVASGGLLRLGGMWDNYLAYQRQNATGSFDVYVYDLTTRLSTKISPNDGHNHRHPYIWNGRVVWFHAGDPPGYYMYDIPTRALVPLNIAQRPDASMQYIMNEGKLVFMDQFVPKVYDLASGRITELLGNWYSSLGAVSSEALVQVQLSASGDQDLYLRRPVTATTRQLVTMTVQLVNQERPALSGDLLVWQDNRGGQWNIYARYLGETSPERLVSQVAGAVVPGAQGDCVAWLSSADGSFAASQYRCLAPYEIHGTVKDVLMDWPDKAGRIDESRLLAGGVSFRKVGALNLDTGEALPSKFIGQDGSYRLLPTRTGHYSVTFSSEVETFLGGQLSQQATVVISDTARSATLDFHAPISLLNKTEEVIVEMTNLPPPPVTDADLILNKFLGSAPAWKNQSYDQRDLTNYRLGLTDNDPWYPGVWRGPGITDDPWTGLERLLMAEQFASRRFTETVWAADDIVKPLEIFFLTSLFASQPFKTKVLPRFDKKGGSALWASWSKKQRNKFTAYHIISFSGGWGFAVPFASDMNWVSMPAWLKASLPKLQRYVNSAIREQFWGDVAFEAVFQTVREAAVYYAIKEWYMPQTQSVLDRAAGRAIAGTSQGDTLWALNNTSVLNDWASDCAVRSHTFTAMAFGDINALRGVKGMYEVQWQKVRDLELNAVRQEVNLGMGGPIMESVYRIQKWAAPLLFIGNAANGAMSFYRAGWVDVPLAATYAFDPLSESLPGRAQDHCPGYSFYTWPRPLSLSERTWLSVPSPAGGEVSAYNQQLDAVLAALQQSDKAAVESQIPALMQADTALDAALERSFLRVSAAYPEASNRIAGFTDVYSDTVGSYLASNDGRAYLHGQLAVWLASDRPESRDGVLSEASVVKQANTTVDASLAQAQAALGSTSIPPAVSLSLAVPERATFGQTTVVTATVTNYGDQAAQGLTLSLTPNETLAVVSSVTSTVGTLAANAEAQVVWQVRPTAKGVDQGAVVEVDGWGDGFISLAASDAFPVSLGASSQLTVELHSPATLLVADAEGRRVGFDPASGQAVNEIPGATYSGPAAIPQYVRIPDPFGAYQTYLSGTGTGNYRLNVSTTLSGHVSSEWTVESVITTGQTITSYLPINFVGAQPTIGRPCLGDFDGDGQTDALDIQRVAGRWLAAVSDPRYERRYDLDGNGEISLLDIMRVAGRWGQTCNSTRTLAPQQAAAAPSNGRTDGSTSLRLVPGGATVAPGQTFTVAVEVADVTDLGAFQFRLGYNPAVLRLDGVSLGEVAGIPGRTWAVLDPEPAPGVLTFGAYSYGSAPGPGGSSELARLRFTALAQGSSPLTLDRVRVADSLGQRIDVGATGSTVLVGNPIRIYFPYVSR